MRQLRRFRKFGQGFRWGLCLHWLLLVGMHNKPLGCGTDKVEWVAGYERDGSSRGWSENSNVVGGDNLYLVDFVPRDTCGTLNLNFIACANVFQSTKIRIAMAGKSDVSSLAWKGGSFNVSDAKSKCL